MRGCDNNNVKSIETKKSSSKSLQQSIEISVAKDNLENGFQMILLNENNDKICMIFEELLDKYKTQYGSNFTEPYLVSYIMFLDPHYKKQKIM